MGAVFLRLLNMSITAAWIVLPVMVLRLLLRKAPRAITVVMWAIVGIRLISPFSFESVLSLIPSTETIPSSIVRSEAPAIQSGISTLNSTLNPVISETLAPKESIGFSPMETAVSVASVVWVIGVAAMLLYTAASYLGIYRKVREAAPLRDNVWLCDRISSPFIFGVIRPRIYLPSSMDMQDMEYVIAHEKAHLKRRDHWWKPFGFLLLTVYWFNPVLWIAYIMFCRDIELACDEKVIRDMGAEIKKPYSEALINCSAPRKTVAACPLAFCETAVKERIRSVLNYRKPSFWIIIAAVIACVAAAVCFLTDPAGTGGETQGDGYYLTIGSDGPENISTETISNLKEKYPMYFDLPTAKGLEVYIWQMAESSYSCGLLPGRNLAYSGEELWRLHLAPTSMEEMRAIVASYDIPKSSVVICPIGQPHSSYLYEINGEYLAKIEELFWSAAPTGDTDVYDTGSVSGYDSWGLSMDIIFKSGSGFEVLFRHDPQMMSEEGSLTTSPQYEIRAINNGETISFGSYMRAVLGKDYADPELSWDQIIYKIEFGGELSVEGDLQRTYGELPTGQYVICKPVTLTTGSGETITKIYTAEFAVVD